MAQAPSIVYYAARTTPTGILLVGQDPGTKEVRKFDVPKDKLNAKLGEKFRLSFGEFLREDEPDPIIFRVHDLSKPKKKLNPNKKHAKRKRK